MGGRRRLLQGRLATRLPRRTLQARRPGLLDGSLCDLLLRCARHELLDLAKRQVEVTLRTVRGALPRIGKARVKRVVVLGGPLLDSEDGRDLLEGRLLGTLAKRRHYLGAE